MEKAQIILSLISGLIGSVIGGGIAVIGALAAVRRTEYFRLAGKLKLSLHYIYNKISDDSGHPVKHAENVNIDTLLNDVLAMSPFWKRKHIKSKWEEYRYDKKMKGSLPAEYTKNNPNEVRKLMLQRLNSLITVL